MPVKKPKKTNLPRKEKAKPRITNPISQVIQKYLWRVDDLVNLWNGSLKNKLRVYIVIPTNGDVNKEGLAVMGAGVAKIFSLLIPGLKKALGSRLQLYGNHVNVFHRWRVITVPVKHHWDENADPQLIERSLLELDHVVEFHKKHMGGTIQLVYLPRLGCGNGNLSWRVVEPIMAKFMTNESRYVLIWTEDDRRDYERNSKQPDEERL